MSSPPDDDRLRTPGPSPRATGEGGTSRVEVVVDPSPVPPAGGLRAAVPTHDPHVAAAVAAAVAAFE
ncbi:hypothetical protein AB0L40_27565, partial [Patulibacter sp. NPDC049589]